MTISARVWHGATVSAAVLALAAEGAVAWRGDTAPEDPRFDRLVHFASYLTTWTVALVAVVALTLVLGLNRDGRVWRAVRLNTVVLPVVIGLVNAVMLRPLDDLQGLPNVADHLQHDLVPILALIGWIVFGPRGRARFADVGGSAVIPVVWVILTFVAGALTDWYPYPFIDVPETGYVAAIVFCAAAASAMVVLAAVAVTADRGLGRVAQPAA